MRKAVKKKPAKKSVKKKKKKIVYRITQEDLVQQNTDYLKEVQARHQGMNDLYVGAKANLDYIKVEINVIQERLPHLLYCIKELNDKIQSMTLA